MEYTRLGSLDILGGKQYIDLDFKISDYRVYAVSARRTYPIIFQITMDYLPIQASAIPCELSFLPVLRQIPVGAIKSWTP